MFEFDLNQEPLTNLELIAEQKKVKAIRKQQIKYSCISDVSHAFVFIALYLNQALTGYAIAVAIAISTVCAMVVAMAGKHALKVTDKISIGVITIVATLATGLILSLVMRQQFLGTIIASLLTGSIVIVGATLGRKIKKVMVAVEELKPIIEDEYSLQELAILCRHFPFLADYRELASHYLRPHLTYGELNAMRQWAIINSPDIDVSA